MGHILEITYTRTKTIGHTEASIGLVLATNPAPTWNNYVKLLPSAHKYL